MCDNLFADVDFARGCAVEFSAGDPHWWVVIQRNTLFVDYNIYIYIYIYIYNYSIQ